MALRHCRVHFTATLVCFVLAFVFGDRRAAGKPPLVDEVRPKVVILGNDFFVPEHYPKNASSELQYDKTLIEELDMKTTDVLCNMCNCASTNRQQHNPPPKIKRGTSSTSVCFVTSYKAHMCAPVYI